MTKDGFQSTKNQQQQQQIDKEFYCVELCWEIFCAQAQKFFFSPCKQKLALCPDFISMNTCNNKHYLQRITYVHLCTHFLGVVE